MNKKRWIILGIALFLTVFVLLPRVGLYTALFDRGDYDEQNIRSLKRIDSLDELTPHTKAKALEFLERCREEGLDVVITETYRSDERQRVLYAKGRTTEGSIVTYTLHSNHTSRRAFDICKGGDDPYGDDAFFEQCARIGKEVGLDCGFYWKGFQDRPHYELNEWWMK
ncbi:M15 family metallopeptidase [Guggenheimella bovis]